ncbi:S1C family serine protease [Candidatus Dependentiae bacterium]
MKKSLLFCCLVFSSFLPLNAWFFGDSWADVQERCRNAVVQVFNDFSGFSFSEPYKEGEVSQCCGSGFLIDESGLIITNYHVVANAKRVQIQVPSIGKNRFDVEVVSISPENDLALIKLCDEGIKKLKDNFQKVPFLRFGSSDKMRRGSATLALGFPLGQEHLKGAQGVVSGWETVTFDIVGFNSICLQTTSPINNGNSGGPTVNKEGWVVGINFAAFSDAQNVGYMIPIDSVKAVIEEMKKTKIVRRLFCGVTVQLATPSLLKFLKCPKGLGGVYVVDLCPEGFAGRMGVEKGDLICEVNGKKIDRNGLVSVGWSDEPVPLLEVISRLPLGADIEVGVFRSGKKLKLKEKKKNTNVPPVRNLFFGYEKIDYEVFGAGFVVMELSKSHVRAFEKHNPLLAKYLLMEVCTGRPALIVTYVIPTCEASATGQCIRMGDLIKSVGDVETNTLKDFRREVERSLKNDEFVVLKNHVGVLGVFDSKKVLKDSFSLVKRLRISKENSVSLKVAEETKT